MIINIRGTSGAGKSTLVKAIMDKYVSMTVYKEAGRKQPIGYLCMPAAGSDLKSMAVIGHYETPCGGCDTIPGMEKIFNLVRMSYEDGHHVLFEGIMIVADSKWCKGLHEDGLPLKVITLDKVPIEVCLSSVNHRRMQRMGPDKYTPVNPKNTEKRVKPIANSVDRLRAAGIHVENCDRDEALAFISKEFGL